MQSRIEKSNLYLHDLQVLIDRVMVFSHLQKVFRNIDFHRRERRFELDLSSETGADSNKSRTVCFASSG